MLYDLALSQLLKCTAYQISLSRWRTSTAFLLKVPDKSPEERVVRDQNIQTIYQELNAVLGPFILPEKVEEHRADLAALSKRGERIGMSILSQPAVWEFQWNIRLNAEDGSSKPRVQRKPLVVFPALRRMTDNKGVRLDPPLVTLKPQLLQ